MYEPGPARGALQIGKKVNETKNTHQQSDECLPTLPLHPLLRGPFRSSHDDYRLVSLACNKELKTVANTTYYM